MFTLQTQVFDELADKGMDTEQVDIFRNLFANCFQELEHRGAVNFTGPVSAPNLATAPYARVMFNWEHSGTLPSQGGTEGFVWCQKLTDGEEYVNENFKVYLPAPPLCDPNVVAGQIIPYMRSHQDLLISTGQYDQHVGSLRMDTVGVSSATGWGAMDGTLNAAALGGSGVDMRSKFPQQYDAIGNILATGGGSTDSITGAALAALLDDHAANTSGSGGAHDHGAATGSGGSHDHTGNTGNTVVNAHASHTHSLTTNSHGVNGTGSTPVSLVDTTPSGTESSSLTHDTHNHTITNESGHTHTITNETAHTHSTPLLAHTGTGSTPVDTIPPYLYVGFLERLDNSRNFLGT